MSESKKKIFAISGSTRSESTNLQIIKAVAAMSEDIFEFDIYHSIADLPHFNPDMEKEGPPPSVTDFRNRINAADGVLICSPEYVFSLPGSLKNALEWTVSTTVFSDKPVALITASSSGEKAHEALNLIMKTICAKFDKEATLLINYVKTKVNVAGEIVDPNTQSGLQKVIKSLEKSIVSSQSS